DLDEAILKANDTPYGLSAGVWTQDVAKAHAVAKRLQAGMVSINEYPVTFPQTPFLGWKQSGLGEEQGVDAVLFYTHTKNVLVNLERHDHLRRPERRPRLRPHRRGRGEHLALRRAARSSRLRPLRAAPAPT